MCSSSGGIARLASVLTALLVAALLLEAGLRLLSYQDSDGAVFVRGLRLRPYRLPVEGVRAKVEEYLEQDTSYTAYDASLGWTVRPMSRSRDGLYFGNAQGIRTGADRPEIALRPASGTLRIAILGDSFTHGSAVDYASTWGVALEQSLERQGVRAEVVNLGVGGYGMDQALLRWRDLGRRLSPDVVVFGFNQSNVRRNMNLMRMLYNTHTGLVFSKPRFVIEGESLRVVNVPTVPPQALPERIRDFRSWELKNHELFYREVDYLERPLHASRLASLVDTGIATRFSSRRKDYDFFARGAESRRLAEQIVRTFEREVSAAGARFLVAHIITRKPLKRAMRGEALRYREMLESIAGRHELVDAAEEMLEAARADSFESLFVENDAHYSAAGNRVVGEAIARALTTHVQARAPATHVQARAF